MKGFGTGAFLKGIFLILLLLLGVGLIGLSMLFHHKINGSGFKEFAEAKVSEMLNAQVHIREIRVGFLNRVALRGLNVEAPQEENGNYHVQIREIIFHYDLWQLLTQNFKMPSSIVLESPEIAIPGEIFPYTFFERLQSDKNKRAISSMEFMDGFIRYKIPSINSSLELKKVQGYFRPTKDESIIRLDFKARASGFIEGDIHVSGEVDLRTRTHTLTLDLDGVSFGAKVPIPVEELEGKVQWKDDSFYFDKLKAVVHGWEISFSGKVEHASGQPVIFIDWYVGKKEPVAFGDFLIDLKAGNLKGKTKLAGNPSFVVDGKIHSKGLRLYFDQLQVNHNYDGDGWFDFQTGEYRLKFEKGKQAVTVVSNLKGLDFYFSVNLNHVKVYGLDLVTSATVHLIPVDNPFRNRLWKFNGVFQTDYFVLEYAPFNDFYGNFEITPFGIKNIVASWGDVFSLKGAVSFRDEMSKPDANMVLYVDGFDLKNVKDFASKPLPKVLGGRLEGKLKIQGALRRPEFLGSFTIKDGILGKLEYDFGVMKFRGFLPYLPLSESRIMKGRTTFSLEGALDWSLPNIFYGVRISTPDKFVIWKGWEINTNQDQGGVEFDRMHLPKLTLQGGTDSGSSVDGNQSQKNEDQYFVIGPKLKF